MTEKLVDRRSALTGGLLVAGAAALASCAKPAPPAAPPEPAPGTPVEGGYKAVGGSVVAKPIVLNCDLKVDPAREQEMIDAFNNKFKPVGKTHKGYIDVKLLKLRTLIQGDKMTAGVNYRFQLTYENEELRQAWVASADHAANWPLIENCFLDKNFQVTVWDSV